MDSEENVEITERDVENHQMRGIGRRCRGKLKQVKGTPRICEDHRTRYEGSLKVVVRITEEDVRVQ